MSVKQMATDEVCVFSGGKKADNGNVSAQRSTWPGVKHLKIERGVSFFWSLKTFFLEIYIKFACWWWFCCRSAKNFHIVLCIWICNSELHHACENFCNAMFILCSIAVWWKSALFFWHKAAGWVAKLYRKRELSRLRWLVQGAMHWAMQPFRLLLDRSSRPYLWDRI